MPYQFKVSNSKYTTALNLASLPSRAQHFFPVSFLTSEQTFPQLTSYTHILIFWEQNLMLLWLSTFTETDNLFLLANIKFVKIITKEHSPWMLTGER